MSEDTKRKGPFTKRQMMKMLAGTATVGLAGCTGGDDTEEGETGDSTEPADEPDEVSPGGTLELGVETSLQTMDPRDYGGLVSIQTYGNLYSQILQWRQVEDGYVLEGDLAVDWGWEEDNDFVVELNEDAEFSNGDPVTAEHVEYTFQSLQDDPFLSVGGDFRLDAMEVSAVDEHTVLFDCDVHIGSLEAALGYSLGIVHKDIDQDRDIRFDPMGSGPFVLDELTDSQIVLSANENYWKTDEDGNQLPYVDEVVFNMFSERQPTVNALEQGELDFIDTVPIFDIDRLQDNSDTKVIMGEPGGRRGIIHFNVTEAPFDDVHARRAMLHAMNWEELTEGVWDGYAEKAGFQATPPTLGWDNAAEDPYDGVDIEAAEAEIEQSQYDKEDFEFTNILRNADDEANRAQESILDGIQSELGIEYDFELLDDESWRTRNADNDDYGFTLMDWSGGWDPDHFITMAWSGEFFNWGGYENEEVDELFIEAVYSDDHEEREAMYQELNELILEDAGKYFAYWYPDIQGARSNVYGIEAGLDLMTYFERVWIDE